MSGGNNKKFEEDYQKAYKACQEQYNSLPIYVKKHCLDFLDRLSENGIAISEIERCLANLKERQNQLKMELIYWYNREITKE